MGWDPLAAISSGLRMTVQWPKMALLDKICTAQIVCNICNGGCLFSCKSVLVEVRVCMPGLHKQLCSTICWHATMQAIHRHVSALQAWTYKQLTALQHSNKQPLLEIFGKHDTPSQQSCLFQFLVHSPNGSVVPAEDVELAAAAAGVHLRTGCHCNPGQCLKVCWDGGVEASFPLQDGGLQLVTVMPVCSAPTHLGHQL